MIFGLLPVIPAVAAATALAQCGKSRDVKKPPLEDKSGSMSKKPVPGSGSVKSTMAKKLAPRSGSVKKSTTSGKSLKEEAKNQSTRSTSKFKPKKLDASTKTVKGASGTLRSKDKSKSKRSTKKSSKSPKSKDKKDISTKSTKTTKSTKVAAPKEVLELSTQELHWKSTGGLQKIVLHNKDKVNRAFKIKCSDNLLYRFSPVYGNIEPNGKFEIDVLRNNGASKIDKLVILTVQAPDEKFGANRWKEIGIKGEPRIDLVVVPLIVD